MRWYHIVGLTPVGAELTTFLLHRKPRSHICIWDTSIVENHHFFSKNNREMRTETDYWKKFPCDKLTVFNDKYPTARHLETLNNCKNNFIIDCSNDRFVSSRVKPNLRIIYNEPLLVVTNENQVKCSPNVAYSFQLKKYVEYTPFIIERNISSLYKYQNITKVYDVKTDKILFTSKNPGYVHILRNNRCLYNLPPTTIKNLKRYLKGKYRRVFLSYYDAIEDCRKKVTLTYDHINSLPEYISSLPLPDVSEYYCSIDSVWYDNSKMFDFNINIYCY